MAQVESLSHSGILCHDLLETEEFYSKVFGVPHSRLGFDAPQTTPRSCMVLGDYQFLFFLPRHRLSMPPGEQNRGTHGIRHGFAVSHGRFEEILQRLKEYGLQFEGPVTHPEEGPLGESVYLKDPGGNFLEICWRRDEDREYNTVAVPSSGDA